VPTKSHISAHLPSSAGKQDEQTKPTVGESFLGFTSQFRLDAKRLNGDEKCQNRLHLALYYFTGWPNELCLLSQQAKRTDGGASNLNVFRRLLAQVHEIATYVLMKEAETRGMTASALSIEGQLARRAILTRATFPLGGWSRPWPDCLGAELQSLPEWQQQAISKGEAVLTRLATLADSETPSRNGQMLHIEGRRPGAFAAKLGISTDTLRRYARLAGAEALPKGRRDFVYPPRDVERICLWAKVKASKPNTRDSAESLLQSPGKSRAKNGSRLKAQR
jgi:hypothetical protein